MKLLYRYFQFLLLLIVSLLGCCAFAAASEESSPVPGAEELFGGSEWDFPADGIHFTLPPEFSDAEGALIYLDNGEIEYGKGVYLLSVWYVGMPKDEFYALYDGSDASEEEIERFNNSRAPLVYIFGIDGNRTGEDLSEYMMQNFGLDLGGIVPAGEFGEYSYYFLQYENLRNTPPEAMGELGSEYTFLYDSLDAVKENLTFYEPVDPYMAGRGIIKFETTDFYGEPVNSEDLFASHKVTMVNIWTTWCGYCVQEMPELETLSHKFEEKDCAIVGLLFDGITEKALADAQAIIDDTQVTYPILLPWDGYEYLYPLEGYPTSIFIDSEGRMVGSPVVGARIDMYEAALEEALDGTANE